MGSCLCREKPSPKKDHSVNEYTYQSAAILPKVPRAPVRHKQITFLSDDTAWKLRLHREAICETCQRRHPWNEKTEKHLNDLPLKLVPIRMPSRTEYYDEEIEVPIYEDRVTTTPDKRVSCSVCGGVGNTKCTCMYNSKYLYGGCAYCNRGCITCSSCRGSGYRVIHGNTKVQKVQTGVEKIIEKKFRVIYEEYAPEPKSDPPHTCKCSYCTRLYK